MQNSMYLSYKTRDDAPVEGKRKVFVSYKKADDKQSHFRDLIISKILDAVDCAVWYDNYLTPGVNFDLEIERAITSCDAVVLLLSKEILQSSYVWDIEIKTAQAQKKPVIPIAYDIESEDLKTACKKLNSNIEVLKYLVNGEFIATSDFDNAFKRSLLTYVVNADLALRIEQFFLSDKHKVSYIYLTPEDRYLMGVGYLRGIGTDIDIDKGIKTLDSIAQIDAEDDESQKMVGEAALKLVEYYIGISNKQKAFDYASIGLNVNNVECMEYIGIAYEEGEVVETDLLKALSIYEKASEAGSDFATYQSGLFYLEGRGVPQNIEKAKEYFTKGAKAGETQCMVVLGKIYERSEDYTKALLWYMEGAHRGNPDAFYGRGYLTMMGLGTERNMDEAREWFKIAAEGGVSAAKETLQRLDAMSIILNAVGIDISEQKKETSIDKTKKLLGTSEDDLEKEVMKQYDSPETLSMSELIEAAENGNVAAMTELGLRYFKGFGGAKKNIEKALEWTEKAAKSGHDVSAMFRLGSLYCGGQGVPGDYAKAKYWAEQAKAHNHPGAPLLLLGVEAMKDKFPDEITYFPSKDVAETPKDAVATINKESSNTVELSKVTAQEKNTDIIVPNKARKAHSRWSISLIIFIVLFAIAIGIQLSGLFDIFNWLKSLLG